MSEVKVKEYSNGEVTVVWKADLCIHSKNCINGLPAVFDYSARPWINATAADSIALMNQVKKCPSGALSYYKNGETAQQTEIAAEEQLVEIVKNGPLLVHGNLIVKNAAGEETRKSGVTAFCRCGGSQNKPYCDGTHQKNAFQG